MNTLTDLVSLAARFTLIIGGIVACDVLAIRAWRRARSSGNHLAWKVVAVGLVLLPSLLVLIVVLRFDFVLFYHHAMAIALWYQFLSISILAMVAGAYRARDTDLGAVRVGQICMLAGAVGFGVLYAGAGMFNRIASSGFLCGPRVTLAAVPRIVREEDLLECGLCCDTFPEAGNADLCWEAHQRHICSRLFQGP